MMKSRPLFIDMTTDQMKTTNAYKLLINRLCRSCPLKNQCTMLSKLIEQQAGLYIQTKTDRIIFQEKKTTISSLLF